MADQGDRGIAWTNTTWNPIRGCTRVSEGCRNCYAETVARRFSGPGQPYEGLVNEHGRWNGVVREIPRHLEDPIRWQRPRLVFVNSMSDAFHESLTDAQIDRIFGVMAAAERQTFQVLTKRSHRLVTYTRTDRREQWAVEAVRAWRTVRGARTPSGEAMNRPGRDAEQALFDRVATGPLALPNVWLGVSVEDERVIHRVRDLLHARAAVRFLSCEPLIGPLGPIPLRMLGDIKLTHVGLTSSGPGVGGSAVETARIDWMILGGESGHGARLCSRVWIDDAIAQARAAGTAVFVKQLGARFVDEVNGVGGRDIEVPKEAAPIRRLRDGHGGDPSEWPPGLNIREFPGESEAMLLWR